MYFLYSALLAVAMLLGLPYWLWQMLRHGKYRAGLRERLGKVPPRLDLQPDRSTIWVHAVSVGEVLAVTGLVETLQQQFPRHRILISTTTDTGQKLACARFGEDSVFYFPLDFSLAIRPYLEKLQPRLVVIAETEVWPNFLRLARQSGARVAIVNARISDRSWRGYRRWRSFLPRILQNVDLFLAQGEEDQRRLVEIGAPPGRLQVAGNLKYDAPVPAPAPVVRSLRDSFAQNGSGPILVCGSTVEDEEPLLLRAFTNVLASHPRAVMILAPRHPERFAEAARLLEQLGVRFWRRSLWNGEAVTGGVLLLDSIGELASVYALGDVAFVGGSLVPRGGHNILEPAQHGVAIVVGNHTENFRDIVELFQSRDAVRVATPAELPLVLMELVANETERKNLGQRAAETLKAQRGATVRTIEALHELMDSGPAPVAAAS
jgi:3-deoxy-D-manno-octulosonic-acid transferase